MPPFVHLHVHSQYSLLDGQASVSALVDKAMNDGMSGIALTDHGNMYGIKEFFNYVNKKNGKVLDKAKAALAAARESGDEKAVAEAEAALTYAKEHSFKPIFGCEMYVAQEDLHTHVDKRDIGRHLIVLAKNATGYHNLVKLVSKAWTEGFYMHPRTDKHEIEKHREGLIIASACLGGEIPQLLMNGRDEEAEAAVAWWKNLMGEDYYIELQRHKATVVNAAHDTYEKQRAIEPKLIALARKYDIKLIATNDVHFVDEDDAEAHDRLICLSTNKFVTDQDRMHYTKQEWLKTSAEMQALFADIPEALETPATILEKVETYTIDHPPIMPNFAIPESFGTEAEYRQRITEQELFDEFTRDENGNVVLSQEEAEKKIKKLGGYEKLYRIKFEADYLAKLAYEGAERRYGSPLSPELKERIKFELHIMKTMGFPGYFLIVQDFINAARNQLGVSVGPGRGSAAGSCVAYCLGITQIDPIKYDLLFERFLNPDRISLPDIDIDFDDDGRADVLRYVTQKYGEEKVAHIITYGKPPKLDDKNRPTFAYGRLIHEHCERRPHFDAGRFAKEFGDEGHREGWCLYHLGCKGPETYGNCSTLQFCDVGGVWPVAIGHPCYGCNEEGIGFHKGIHQLANVENQTPRSQKPDVNAKEGGNVSAGAIGLLGGVVGLVAGVSVMAVRELGRQQKKDNADSRGE